MVAGFSVPGRAAPSQQEQRVTLNFVTPRWFETYGVTIRRGRAIDGRDTLRSAPVVVANEAFVRRFFPDGEAVGSFVSDSHSFPDRKNAPKTIVGVVGDSVDQSLRDEAFPTLYLPLAQLMQQPAAGSPFMSFPEASLSVRTTAVSPSQVIRGLAAALTSVDRNLTFTFQLLDEQIDAARHQERLVAWLSGLFATLALLLAAVGVYGVTSYSVTRRRAEIGLRMALGAQRRDVMRLAIRQTMLMTVGGVILGIPVAAAVTRYLRALLFGITPLDPISFVTAPLLLLLIALLACYLPARRATTIDPMMALRCE